MCTKLLLWYEVLCLCVLGRGVAVYNIHHPHPHTHTHTQDHTDTSFENVKLHEYRPPDEGDDHALE